MVLFQVVVLSLYLTSLLAFSYVSNSIAYCLLLGAESFLLVGWVFSIIGTGWFLLIFCLVYIGGVFILFIFTTLQDPNPTPQGSGGGIGLPLVILTVLTVGVSKVVSTSLGAPSELGLWICNSSEGAMYLFLCFVLAFSFFLLAFISSNKGSFFR